MAVISKNNSEKKLNTLQELNKEEGLREKIGNFFEKIGYNIASFAADHPLITKASVVLLSTVAGYFTGGGFAGAIGGAVAGVQRGKDVIKFCEEFVEKYEIELTQKEIARANSIGAKSNEHALSQDKNLVQTEPNIHYHNHHAKDVANNKAAHNNETHSAGV